jgi:beta-xylosidase
MKILKCRAKKISKYPLKYRKIFYPATDNTRAISMCYHLHLDFVLLAFKFKFGCTG